MTCRLERDLVALAAVAIAAGCSGLPDHRELEPTASVHQDVARGTVAPTCAFPTVMAVTDQRGRCSATLVHPRLVLFAAHCGMVNQVDFGEKWNQLKVMPEKCAVNPAYRGNTNNDSAYCLLKEPVNLPITPILPRQCAQAVLQRGVQVMITGFGRSTNSSGEGTKRYGWASLQSIDFQASRNVMKIGQPSVGCPGDSGGPGLFRLTNGTWWSVGIASTLGGADINNLCLDPMSSNDYNLSVNAAAWIEQATGIDITPCSDESGNWEAGPECKNVFAADVGIGSGDWTTNPWCQGTKAVDVPESCVGVGPSDAGPIEAGGPMDAGNPARDANRDDGARDGAPGDRSTNPPADVVADSRADERSMDENPAVQPDAPGSGAGGSAPDGSQPTGSGGGATGGSTGGGALATGGAAGTRGNVTRAGAPEADGCSCRLAAPAPAGRAAASNVLFVLAALLRRRTSRKWK